MTESETIGLLAYLRAAYPATKMKAETVAVWTEALADVDAKASTAAARRLVKTSTFMPSIAEIRSTIQTSGLPTAEEAWILARGAISDHPFLDTPIVEVGHLPGVVVDAMQGLPTRDIQRGDVGARAHFFRIYGALREAELSAQAPGLESGEVPACLDHGMDPGGGK